MGLKEYLQNGSKQSSMRLIFVLTGLSACIIALSSIIFQFILALAQKPLLDMTQVAFLVGVLLGAATAGKVGQSITESKDNRNVLPPK